MRVDKNGQHLWTKTLNLTTNDNARSGQVIGDKIYITGSIGEDLFVKRFDLDGNSDIN